ncbi:MAG: phosphate ABC transporter permease subunit PstC, partial [Coraliomargarita sp.]|nr:phosphate ABC transporter permease subunit PstC [Coraliomargarita sp.]
MADKPADQAPSNQPAPPAFGQRRSVIFGKDSDTIIKSFFGSSATVALVVLTLITIFLFKEGASFVGLYHKSLQEYRLSGLEYVDILKEKREGYTALTRYLNDIRAEWINELKDKGYSQTEINEAVKAPEAKALFMGYMRTGSDLRRFIKEKMDTAIEIRDLHVTNENLRTTLDNYAQKIDAVGSYNYKLNDEDRAQFILRLNDSISANSLATERNNAYRALATELRNGKEINTEERETFLHLLQERYESLEKTIVPVDFQERIHEVTNEQERYADILHELDKAIHAVLQNADQINFDSERLTGRAQRFKELNEMYLGGMPEHKAKLADWDQNAPLSISKALGAFLTGRDWTTASDQQDWYGLLPLLSGS